MNKENKDVNINIRVPKNIKSELVKLADKNKRSLSDFLRLYIEGLVVVNVNSDSKKD